MSNPHCDAATSTFVLIAGAWHGAWCWERVAPLLAAAGHRVLALDLLGMGADRTPRAGVTLASWADQITAVVEQAAAPVVLVGHSRGGCVISEVDERVPDRIATLRPEPGATDILQIRENGSAIMPGAIFAAAFYNAIPAGWTAAAVGRLSPEPTWVHATPLAVTPTRFDRVRRAYAETTDDHGLPLEIQRSMQAALSCDPVFTLDGDHSSFFSRPDELAACLLSVAASVEQPSP